MVLIYLQTIIKSHYDLRYFVSYGILIDYNVISSLYFMELWIFSCGLSRPVNEFCESTYIRKNRGRVVVVIKTGDREVITRCHRTLRLF